MGKPLKEKIGIIGLGHMGRAVARRLQRAGYTLGLYNRTLSKAEAFLQLGASIAPTPEALARVVDVLVTVVSDDRALDELAFGDHGFVGGLRENTVYIDMSTLSEEIVSKVAAAAEKVGATMLHAPILGGPVDVFLGRAAIFVGGDLKVVNRVRPVLHTISQPVHHVGELTKGTHMKMALNIMLTHFLSGTASSLAFAKRAGLNQELVHEILSRIASGVVERIGEKMLSDEKGVTFDFKNLEKDQRYFLAAAKRMGLELPTIAAAHKLFKGALKHGWGDEDYTAVYRILLEEK